jgi:hypothetical protein
MKFQTYRHQTIFLDFYDAVGHFEPGLIDMILEYSNSTQRFTKNEVVRCLLFEALDECEGFDGQDESLIKCMVNYQNEHKLYIPLKFWFSQGIETVLPTHDLDDAEIQKKRVHPLPRALRDDENSTTSIGVGGNLSFHTLSVE